MIKVHLQKKDRFIGTAVYYSENLIDLPEELGLSLDICPYKLFLKLASEDITCEIDTDEMFKEEKLFLALLRTAEMIAKAQWTLNIRRKLIAFGKEYSASDKRDLNKKLVDLFRRVKIKEGRVEIISYGEEGKDDKSSFTKKRRIYRHCSFHSWCFG